MTNIKVGDTVFVSGIEMKATAVTSTQVKVYFNKYPMFDIANKLEGANKWVSKEECSTGA